MLKLYPKELPMKKNNPMPPLDAAEQKVRILTETAVGITEENFNA